MTDPTASPAPRRPSLVAPSAVLVAVVAAVLAGALAGLLAGRGAVTWQSTAVLSIDEPKAVASAADAGIIDKLGRLRYAYVGLVGTDRIAGPVAQRLGFDIAAVRGHLLATALPTDLLVRVSGTAGSAALAQQTAEQLAGALVEYAARQQAGDGVPSAQRVVFTIVDHAREAVRIAPRRSRTFAAAVVAGVAAAAAVLLVAARLRRRSQS